MKRILFITTGGTIACKPQNGALQPQTGGEEMLELLPELRDRCEIEVREAFNLDSSNIQPEEWNMLAHLIFEQREDYDGFVISHGTDTMAYTASALTFMLPYFPKPVVLTGSQLPLDAPDSDGIPNLSDAFTVAMDDHPGVMLVFGGWIIRGCRASKHYTRNREAFTSVNVPPLGYLEDGCILWQAPTVIPSQPAELADRLESRVLLLKLAPGLGEDWIKMAATLGYRGIVVEAYGSGNVPNGVSRRDLHDALRQCIKDHGITVVVTSQCPYEPSNLTLYSLGQQMLQAGAIPGGDSTTEALYTKLCWVLGQTQDPAELRRMMQSNLAGELTTD